MLAATQLNIIDFIQEHGYEIDRLYVDRFWINISDDKWIYVGNDVLKWIGYQTERKRRAKDLYVKLLSKHFCVNDDYRQLSGAEIESFYVPTHGDIEIDAHNKTKHLIVSPDCFKESLMLMSTNRAKEIRKYYLVLEKVCKAYTKYQHEFESSALRKQVNEMKALQADVI